MKIKRSVVIDRIDQEVARREQEAESQYQEKVEAYMKAYDAYRADFSESWKEFADKISAVLASDGVVGPRDVPKRLLDYGRLEVFKHSMPVRQGSQSADLLSLKLLLEATDDETVTIAELNRIGFRIGALFSA